MRTCPACAAGYDVSDAVCRLCGAELPAPYEAEDAFDAEEEAYFEDDEVESLSVATAGIAAVSSVMQDINDRALKRIYATPSSEEIFATMPQFSPGQVTILSGATIYVEDEEITPSTVIIGNGRIVDVWRGALANPENGATFIDLTGQILTPGFIEIHFHGMMGIDTNQASAEDFLRLSAEAAKRGLTTMTPTTVACPAHELLQVVQNLRAARELGFPGARFLGLHLESNFISMEKKGAQPPEYIFAPTDPRAHEILQVIDDYQDEISIVTLAPEVPGALELIPWLRERDIIASLGHSTATYEQAIAGFDAGATHATHLFNAMPPLNHREPGLVGAALERDDVYAEMVCDGVHIHPAVIATAITAKGAERFVPVSDSLQGAGMRDGETFYLGGQHVTVRNGVARLDNGVIAGSIVTMDGVVRVLVEQVQWALSEALSMASTTPAEALELASVGRIALGAVADFIALDSDLQVQMTMVGGKVVYQA